MDKIIKHCQITCGRFQNTISVSYDDGTVEERLGVYYPDELHYSEIEFLGLTRKQAKDLMHERDRAYLQR